jgi:hypothetical protein
MAHRAGPRSLLWLHACFGPVLRPYLHCSVPCFVSSVGEVGASNRARATYIQNCYRRTLALTAHAREDGICTSTYRAYHRHHETACLSTKMKPMRQVRRAERERPHSPPASIHHLQTPESARTTSERKEKGGRGRRGGDEGAGVRRLDRTVGRPRCVE